MSDLYKFSDLKCDNPGAPQLVPAGSFNNVKDSSNYILRDSLYFGSGIIDVVNNFQWTTSPPGTQSRQEVPGITLREKRLRTNSMIAGAFYYLASGSSSLGTLAARGGAVANSFVPGSTQTLGNIFNNVAQNPAVQNAYTGISNIFTQSVLNSVATLTTGTTDINQILSKDIEGLNSNLLKSYEGLYITEDTKFRYYLPYFTDQLNVINNSFTENDATFRPDTNMGKGVEEIRGAAEALARFANFAEPGIYIERPKFFSFNGSGDRITVEFPLLNTGWSTYEDVKRNWQLVFMLTYQNRPNRRSRELIDPACIYEVSIPGVKYLPFAYMSDISIDFLGSRRTMELEVPTSNGTSTINAIIPDAYKISLTLTGLVSESQNFLAAMLTDKQDIVSVVSNQRFNPFGEIANSFVDANAAENRRLQQP